MALAITTLSERLNTSEALFVIVPASEPAVPPSPICSVPEEIRVFPEKVFSPVRASVPPPSYTRFPAPLMEPAEVRLLERLKTTVASLVILPASEPLAPPAAPLPVSETVVDSAVSANSAPSLPLADPGIGIYAREPHE
jgi:hypothetical protein